MTILWWREFPASGGNGVHPIFIADSAAAKPVTPPFKVTVMAAMGAVPKAKAYGDTGPAGARVTLPE